MKDNGLPKKTAYHRFCNLNRKRQFIMCYFTSKAQVTSLFTIATSCQRVVKICWWRPGWERRRRRRR